MSNLHAVVAQIERASEEAVKQWTEQGRPTEERDKQDRQHLLASVPAVVGAVIGGLLCLAGFITVTMLMPG
jgi:hypothetical protein